MPSIKRNVVLCIAILFSPKLSMANHFSGLSDLPGGSFASYALAVSADGSVVVGWGTHDSNGEAFRWTQAFTSGFSTQKIFSDAESLRLGINNWI
jgi:probable HAF family extracellular repeat protein